MVQIELEKNGFTSGVKGICETAVQMMLIDEERKGKTLGRSRHIGNVTNAAA